MKARKKNTTRNAERNAKPRREARTGNRIASGRRLRQKPGADFEPYLARFLRAGDAATAGAALLEYANAHWPSFVGQEVDPAFIELVGQMAVLDPAEYGPLVQKIMRAIDGAWESKATCAAAYRYWEKELTPLAKEAKAWIRRERHGNRVEVPTRGILWNRYLKDERRAAFQRWENLPESERRELHDGLDVNGQALFLSRYLDARIVPRSLFYLLAETREGQPRRVGRYEESRRIGKRSPSDAVRLWLTSEPLRLPWPRHLGKAQDVGAGKQRQFPDLPPNPADQLLFD